MLIMGAWPSKSFVCHRDAFNSGFLLARAKRSKLDVDSMDLLVYQNGGTSGIIYPSSVGETQHKSALNRETFLELRGLLT